MNPRFKKALGYIGITALTVAWLGASIAVCGCGPKTITAATANKSVSQVIADAGILAITAEQQYQAGTIPQTPAARSAINDLGSAYNQARQLFSAVLYAQATTNGATTTQLAACAPGGTAAACTDATAKVTAAQTVLNTSQAQLTVGIGALTAKTAAVKGLTAKP